MQLADRYLGLHLRATTNHHKVATLLSVTASRDFQGSKVILLISKLPFQLYMYLKIATLNSHELALGEMSMYI